MIRNNSLSPLIEGYLEYLAQVARKAPGTVRDVRCTLRRIEQAIIILNINKDLWKLSLKDCLRWIEYERESERSSQCISKYISHLRGFLNYAWRSGRTERNVLDGFNLQDDNPRTAPQVLTIEEARLLIESCSMTTFPERQARMIILLLYGCGLRTAELCQLNVQDINRQTKDLFVSQGKGQRQRMVPIPEGVYTELMAYLLDRGGKRGPLFRTEIKRRRITAKNVCEVVRQATERAGIEWKVTPKTLRHSYATHLMDRGVDLAIISSLMGHRSPAETGVYLHVLEGRPRKAVNELDSKNGRSKS